MKNSLFMGDIPDKLSIVEQNNLIIEYYNGNKEARSKLIMHNIRLVSHVIFEKFTNTGIDMSDLFSIGIEGLIKGVDSYNPNKNSKYSYYLCKCIENSIYMEIRNNSKNSKFLFIEPYYDEKGTLVNPSEFVPSKVNIESNFIKKETNERLWYIISCLSDMEKDIVISRYFNTKSRDNIGRKYGTSGSNIELIEKKILKNIKEQLISEVSLDKVIEVVNKSLSDVEVVYKDMFNYYFNLNVEVFYTMEDISKVFNVYRKNINKIIDSLLSLIKETKVVDYLIKRRKEYVRIYTRNSKLIKLYNKLRSCNSKKVLEVFNYLEDKDKEIITIICGRELKEMDYLREYSYIELKDGERALSKLLLSVK